LACPFNFRRGVLLRKLAVNQIGMTRGGTCDGTPHIAASGRRVASPARGKREKSQPASFRKTV
jgi:hypothetical protein